MNDPKAPNAIPSHVSQRRREANRRNAQKSTGPNSTLSTRFNAAKHGLVSAGITELDDADGYRDLRKRLGEGCLDELDAFLVERIALYMVRLRRTARLEAEFITGVLNPPIYGEGPLSFPSFSGPVLDPGIRSSLDSDTVQALVSTFQRYESANENKLYRAINQLERIRRIQQGELLPAPVAVDVGVHSDHRDAGTNAKPAQMVREDSRSEPAGEGDIAKESASA